MVNETRVCTAVGSSDIVSASIPLSLYSRGTPVTFLDALGKGSRRYLYCVMNRVLFMSSGQGNTPLRGHITSPKRLFSFTPFRLNTPAFRFFPATRLPFLSEHM